MGLFSSPKAVVLKESSDAREYLRQLKELKRQASGETFKKIEKEISIVQAGIQGEENILFELKNSGMDMVILHDIYLESKSGAYAQIDFLVLTPKVNVVIECKNLFGNIEITNKGEFIRTVEYGGRKYREGLYSPITQNQRHLQVLKECGGERQGAIMRFFQDRRFDNVFKGLVVLANPRTIVNDRWAKKEVKEQVVRADQLIDVIKRMNQESNEKAVSPREFLPFPSKHSSMEKICPKCGRKLVLREAKRGTYAGEKFYGCSGYPACHYIEKL